MEVPQNSVLIASGPVIIENNHILLVRPQSDLRDYWVLPGGKVRLLQETPEEACIREVHEELGLEIEIIKPMRTLVIPQAQYPDRVAVLIHFLAHRKGEPKMTKDIVEWAWHDLHALPENCTQNVREMVQDYLKENL